MRSSPAEPPARGAGFSLFELVVVICIVAILAVVLNSRLQKLQAQAERAAMEHVLGSLRSAAALRVAKHVAQNTLEEIPALAETNPMEHLSITPANYRGVFGTPNPGEISDGGWYFDRERHELVYLVRHDAYFDTELPPPTRARFKFELLFADHDGDGRLELGRDEVEGLTIAAVEPYRWRN